MNRIGPYEVVSEIARGGMGMVYSARDPRVDRPVAIKLLIGVTLDAESLQRFQREAQALARLQHPNVVRVHELGWDGNQPYLVMELVEGSSLSDRIKRGGPYDAPQAAELVESLARAMQRVHEHKVLHRDLKPANVLLRPTGEPVITDFGLARLEDARQSLTATGQVLGSPNYMAPEQANSQRSPPDVRTDVYGLGATLYETLTGRPPFGGNAILQVMSRVLHEPPEPFDAGTDPGLIEVCLRCLEKDPADRYASAEELADALADYQALPSRPSRPRAPRVVAVLAPVLLLAGGLAWALAGSGDPDVQPPPPREVVAPAPVDDAQRAQDLVDAGRFGEAEALAARVLERDPRSVRARIVRTWVEVYRPDYVTALEVVSEVIDEGHGSCEVYALQALVYRGLQQPKNALASSERAIDADPDDPAGYVARGEVYHLQRKFHEAQADVEHALQRQPGSASALHLRAMVLSTQGQHDEAMKAAREGLRLTPHDRNLATDLAFSQWQTGHLDDAVATMAELAAARPRDPRVRRIYGFALGAKQQPEKAIAEYDAALELWPDYSEAQISRAQMNVAKQSYDEAMVDVDACLATNTNYAEAYTMRSQLRLVKRDTEGALEDAEAALRLHRKAPLLWSRRGDIYLMTQKNELAEKDYDRAVQLQPRSPEYVYKRGLMRQKQGKLKGAGDDFERAWKLKPRSPLMEEIVFTAANHFSVVGREHDARAALSWFVENNPTHARTPEAERLLRRLQGN